MHLHRFLWRDSPDEEIREYAITRVNIGDRLYCSVGHEGNSQPAQLCSRGG